MTPATIGSSPAFARVVATHIEEASSRGDRSVSLRVDDSARWISRFVLALILLVVVVGVAG